MRTIYLLLLLAINCALFAQVPTNGLVAYYPFNGNANDASGNANNGTAQLVSYGIDRFGSQQSAAVFSGQLGVSSAVDCPTLNSFQYLPITYSCWFNLSALTIPPGSTLTLVGRERSDFPGIEGALTVYPSASFSYDFAYGAGLIWFKNIHPSTSIWYHCVLTINADALMSFYVNGVLYDVVQSSTSALAGAIPLPFRIGASTLATGQINTTYPRYSWPGTIDDVRLYNRALSASEVQSLYQFESTTPIGSLVVTLFNAENWGQPGTNARVVLYNASSGQVAQGQANSSSMVTFSNILAGSGYYYRVYVNSSSLWGEEFWGEKTGITINANQTTYDTHTHNTPYMPVVSVYIDGTNELLPDGAKRPVQPGTRLRIELQIKNPAYAGAQTVSAYGGLYLDRDQAAPYDVNLTTSPQSYLTGTTKAGVFYCDAPTMPGDYYLSVGAFASSNRYATTLTDASGWHDPAFTVGNVVTDYWVYTNGPGVGNDVRSFAVDSRGRLLAGTWSSGGTVWRTSDNGNSWIQLGTIPISDPVMGISVNAQDYIFISVITKGFYRSTDEGASWQLKSNGLTNLRIRGNLVDKKGFVWVASEGGLFRSTNNADSWVSMLGGSFGCVYLDSANAIVTLDASNIYRSTNDGGSWTSTPMSIGVGPGGIHPDGSYLGWTSSSAIYRSTNIGVSWTNLNNPYAYTGYTAALTFNARGDIFYAKDGDNAGVVMSTNMGTTWTEVNSGLATKRVLPLVYHPNGYVYVGTGGYGVFRTRVATQPVPYNPLPPWKFANTGVSHTIIIPTGVNPNINGTALAVGDYVGVFYDSLGTFACAGYEKWTGSGSIAVSAFGDDPTSGAKDGLSAGEVFRWKIFRASGGLVYDAQATYSGIGGVVTHTSTYATNGISQLSSLTGGLSVHNMSFRSGWSLISSYVIPQSTTLDNIFAAVLTDLIILKNGAQKTYIPSVPVNSIGPWVKTEGYQIKMSNARAVGFTGQKILPWTLTIPLPLGWSIMPYVRDSDMSIASALSGVVSDVVLVKDQDGKTYIPSVGVNSISTLKVGQGYQIKMATARTIEYPANAALATIASGEVTATRAKQSVVGPSWFFSNTGTSHTFIIPTSVNPVIDGTPLASGDYIGVFYDSSGTLACAGFEPWTGTSNIAIAAFGDDATTPAKDGLTAGEALRWKIWRQADGHVFVARATYQSPGAMGGIVTDTSQYTTNGISAIATLSGSVTSVNGQPLPTEFVLMQNYPNPFNPSTRIAYGLAANVHVRLTVLNTLGQEVATLVNGNQEVGYYEVEFDARGFSSGVYLYRLQAGSFAETKKLLLVR